jgi:nucleoside diphosphate kinase
MLESKFVLVVYLKIFKCPSCMQAGQTNPIKLANNTIRKDFDPHAEFGFFIGNTINPEV